VRQMLGSANISGSRALHIMTGNLSHQIEHHLFPDLPSSRYAEIAVEVREVFDRYGLNWWTGVAIEVRSPSDTARKKSVLLWTPTTLVSGARCPAAHAADPTLPSVSTTLAWTPP
jgi:fatty acid desaturase